MRIYYHLSSYVSHCVTGLEYVACLQRLGHDVILDAARAGMADVAILHDGPENYQGIFARLPELAPMRTIGICVWENETLPDAYKEALRLVREIWTPSHFSLSSILPHFPHARLLPHVVRRVPVTKDDLEYAGRLLGDGTGGATFLCIVDMANPRKNGEALLRIFSRLRAECGDAVRLVLKQYRLSTDLSSLPGVVSINESLTDGQIAALHILSDAYVSAHHAEGWGLGLSQAMAYGKPVIATGYSGNMEYMNRHNSYPVEYTMAPVSRSILERLSLFSEGMSWAEVDEHRFTACMRRVAERRVPDELTDEALNITERYGRDAICGILGGLLANPALERNK